MTTFRFGDIVRAPFPHVERAITVPRPGVVLANWPTPVGELLWVAMITNAAHADWPGDVAIENAAKRGLIIPSKVRTAKVATVVAIMAAKIGTLDRSSKAEVRRLILDVLEAY